MARRTEAGAGAVARLAPLALALLGAAGAVRAQSIAPPNQSLTPPSQATPETGNAARDPDRVLIFGLRSSVTLSDNLLLANDAGDRRAGMALEASPYAIFQNNTPRLQADVRYILRNVYRTEGQEFTLARSALDARATARLADSVFVDAFGRIANVNASPFGPFAIDPVVSGVNLTTARAFGISPYIRSQVPQYFDYELRYRYNWASAGAASAVSSLQALSASANTGQRLGRWQASWFGDAQWIQRSGLPDFQRRLSVATLSYLLTQEVRVGGIVNWESIDLLANASGRTSGYGYGAFVDWRPNSRLATNVTWQRRFWGDASSASASWRLRRFFLQANYSRSVLSSADASLLFLDPSSLLAGPTPGFNNAGPFNPFNNLLNNPLANAVLQQQFLLFGLSPLNFTFFSNALVVDRRATLGASLAGPQNSVSTLLFHNERDSVLQQTGSAGGVGLGGNFQGQLRQTGVDAGYTHRLDARTSVFVNGRRSVFEVDGLGAGALGQGRTTQTFAATGVSVRLTADAIASMLARRTVTDPANGASTTENALVGVLDVRF